MSLKARLRLAVALLMSAMVVFLSVLYIQSFLETAFQRTHATAESLGLQLRSAVEQELRLKAIQADPRPADADGYRRFFERTAATDPEIDADLARARDYWKLVEELFITDQSGVIRVSSVPNRSGLTGGTAPNLAEWTSRTLFGNMRQILWDGQAAELRFPIAIAGEAKPVLDIHVVVNSVFIRDELERGLRTVAMVCLACLIASLVLALVLPNVVMSPLERLGRSIDLMATGKAAVASQPGEAKEFAAVYSKLNALGQQYLGAQENVDVLRGNVQQMLERLEEAVLLFDAGGHLTMGGRAVGQLLGTDPAGLIGASVADVFGLSGEIGPLVQQAIEENRVVRDELVSLTSPDRDCAVLVSVQPLARAHAGQRMGTLVTLRDAETRGELAAQLDMAGRLTALSQLTRGVAHEIKNPLNAIALHVEVLRSRLEEEMPEVGVIAREISRLDRVVKTFLDFNRPIEPHLAPIDMNELTRDIAGLVTPEAQSRQIRVQVKTAPRPAMLNGDRDLLKQAVLNVVMNAMEAMHSGGELRLETARRRGTVELLVADNGPGIPPEVRDKIFNLYFSTKEKGSGIGLAMAFRLVQLHDGKIDFSTETGEGTTFRFSFPEASSPTQADLELSRSHGA